MGLGVSCDWGSDCGGGHVIDLLVVFAFYVVAMGVILWVLGKVG